MPSDGIQTVPIRFMGKPLRMLPRSHSTAVQATAKAITRPASGSLFSRTAKAASAGKSAKNAERPITAGTISQPKREGSVRNAAPIQ